MIASSAFVLAALTLTGVYMKEGNVESKDDGYTVDFSAAEQKEEKSTVQKEEPSPQAGKELNKAGGSGYTAQVTEDDLDYMPMEAGSSLVEIPGLTGESPDAAVGTDILAEGASQETAEEKTKPEDIKAAEAVTEKDAAAENEAVSGKSVVVKELGFSEGNGLTRPVSGEVLLPYSMDASIYFATLDQYKYNPAVIFSAEEGASVLACAEGKVINVFEDAEIGHAVTLELGNGYQATYGQLTGIQVTLDSYVNPGDTIASVAAPTKYFGAEGSNLYFKLTKDGAPVNPQQLF